MALSFVNITGLYEYERFSYPTYLQQKYVGKSTVAKGDSALEQTTIISLSCSSEKLFCFAVHYNLVFVL